MNKIEAAQVILPLIVGYFSVSGERLVDLKVFGTWCALTVLIASHIHSIYLLSTNNQMEFWVRYASLNIAALGLLVLFGTALFLKKYLREELLSKMNRA
jgi:intracellular septation protein A